MDSLDNPWDFNFYQNQMHPLELIRLHPERHKSEVLYALMISECSLNSYSARGKHKRNPSSWLQAIAFLVHQKWEREKQAQAGKKS